MHKLHKGRAAVLAALVLACCLLVVIELGPGSKNMGRSLQLRDDASSGIGWTSVSGVRPAGAVFRELNVMKAVFAQSEDTYEAMFAPPPATKMAMTAVEDNMTIAPAATLDKTGKHAFLSKAAQSTIESRALAALNQAFTPAMAGKESRIVVGVVSTISSGQDLLGGGGASVVKYQSESITGNTAAITASVKQWSRIGYVNPVTGKVYWQINRAIVIVKDSLAYTAGTWKVASRTWDYAPGQGP
jgi:hypothetical protein